MLDMSPKLCKFVVCSKRQQHGKGLQRAEVYTVQKFTRWTRATCSKGLHVQFPQLLHLGNRNLTIAEG